MELGGLPPSLSPGGTEVKSEHVSTQVGVWELELILKGKIKKDKRTVLYKVDF